MNKGLVTAIALLAAIVSGCTAGTDKSGGELQPTVLVLASADGTSMSSPAVAEFVRLVDELSEGRVQVEVSPDWRSRGEQPVLEDVAAGKAALGWSGTRALDLVGVDAFRPLHAPFLINSYGAQSAVVGDEVAQDMLSALDGSQMTGLALLADELRFPAAAERPLVNPEDFQDLYFGTAPSNAQAAAVAALGARAKGLVVPHPPHTDGLGGLETMWWTYIHNDQQRVTPFITANAVLWPRTTVIVGNRDVLADLSEQDLDAVTEAAEQAQDWSIDHADDGVTDEMVAACGAGARIAIASAHQLVALRQAAEQAYSDLRADPEQATVLGRIERLVGGARTLEPLEVPAGCAYHPGDEQESAVSVLPPVLDGPGSPGELPAGTYRYTLTEDEIRQGVDMGAPFPSANAGVWTWTLGDGRWSYKLKLDAQEMPEGFAGDTCEGYYDVHGDQVDFTTVTVYASGDCASRTWKATWRETGDGLVMDVTTDGPDLDFLFGAKLWERIG